MKHLNIEVGQVLKTLESYRHVLNRSLDSLTILELDDLVTVLDVANTLQRFEMVRRISEEITRYLLELEAGCGAGRLRRVGCGAGGPGRRIARAAGGGTGWRADADRGAGHGAG